MVTVEKVKQVNGHSKQWGEAICHKKVCNAWIFLHQTTTKQLEYQFTIFFKTSIRLKPLVKIILQQNRSTHISNIFSFGCTFQGNFPMHWHHSLILKTAVRNSHIFNWVFPTFPTYCGKFFGLSLYLYIQQSVINHLANSDITFKHPIKATTQTRFMVLFTSGSSSVWGESHRTSPPGISWLSICNK